MTFDRLNRRTHLYLAMFLMPWFLMWGITSIPFSHSPYFEKLYDDGTPTWVDRFEREYQLTAAAGSDERQFGAQILRDLGIEGSFGTYRPKPRTLIIYVFSFWSATQVVYDEDENRLVVQDRRDRWDHILTGMHARGGFTQESFLDDAWGVTVDFVMVAILTWIATGIYMWWGLRSVRRWGLLALGGGLVSFTIFLLAL